MQLKTVRAAAAQDSEDDPNVGTVLSNPANSLAGLNRLREAEQHIREALAIDRSYYGEQHASVARDLNNLGLILHEAGRYNDAAECFRQAIEINGDDAGPDRAQALSHLARTLDQTQHSAEALTLHDTAIAQRRALAPNGHQLAAALTNASGAMLRAGRIRDGLAAAEEALALDEAIYGPDHPELISDLNNIAAVHMTLDHPDRAQPLLERADAIAATTLGPTQPGRVQILVNLAELHQQAGRQHEATKYWRLASAAAAALPAKHHLRTTVTHALGQRERRAQQIAAAADILTRALNPRPPRNRPQP